MAGIFENLDWENWVLGIAAGFIGGGASAVTSGITLNLVDSHDFNIYTGKFYITVAAVFVVNGMMSTFLFLKQNPVPAVKTTVTKVQQRTDAGTVTKVEQTETITTPVKPPDKKTS